MGKDIKDSAPTEKPMLPDEETDDPKHITEKPWCYFMNYKADDPKYITEEPCWPFMNYKADDPKYITEKPCSPFMNYKADDPKHITEEPCCPFMKYKADPVRTVLFLLLIIALIVFIPVFITNRTRPSCKSAPCEDGWIWSRGKCYFFSTMRDTWNNSERFCKSHDASLALIDNKEELDLLFRIKGLENHWIGLGRTEDNTAWTWTNGTLYNETLFTIRRSSNEANEYVYLSYKDVGSEHWSFGNHWICNKI